MNCPPIRLRSALALHSLALVFLALVLGSGCDQSTSVSGTVPQNGETNVDPKSNVQITYATSFSSKVDDQAELTNPENFQVTGRTGKQYKGAVTVASSGTKTSRTVNTKSTGNTNTKDNSNTTNSSTTQKLNDTLVFNLASGASFDLGDVITVRVGGGITVRGNTVSTHTFKFRVKGEAEQGATGDLRVLAVAPETEKLGVRQPVRTTADFSRSVKQDRLPPTEAQPSAITLRGEHSGVHAAGQTTFPRNAGDKKVLQVAQRLNASDSFLPGEWVTVTLSDEIEGAEVPSASSTAGLTTSNHLQPFNYRFQVIPGKPKNGWSKLPASAISFPGAERAIGTVAADIRVQNGTEFVVFSEDRVDLFSQEQGGFWTSKTLNAKDLGAEQGMAVSDAAVADVDGSGIVLIVLLTGATGSEVRTYEVVVEGLRQKGETLQLPAAQARRLLVSDLDGNGLQDLLITHPSREYDAKEADGSTRRAVTGNATIVSLTRGTPDPFKLLAGDPSAFTIVPQPLENPLPDLPPIERIEVRDLDGDGRCDLVVETTAQGEATGKILLVQNRGAPSARFNFGVSRELRGRGGLGTLAARAWTAADLDADGDVDIVAWDRDGSVFYENPLNPKVKRPANQPARTLLGEDVKPVALDLPRAQEGSLPPLALDLNGDALIDLVLASKTGRSIQFLLGKQGTAREFQVLTLPALAVGGRLAGLAVADIDGDTGLDVVAAGDGSAAGPVLEIIQSDGAELEGEVLTSSFRIDPGETVIGEDEVRVVVKGDIAAGELWAGYSVVLDYEENRLEFLGFERSPRFPAATYTFCPDDNGTGCSGFAALSMKLDTQLNSQQRGPTGNDIPLGAFLFKPKTVSSRSTAKIFLANGLSRNGTTEAASMASNSLLVAEGSTQRDQAVALEGDLVEVVILPKPLKIVRTQVGAIQNGLFVVKVVWTATGSFAGFDLTVDGDTPQPVEITTSEEGYVANLAIYTGDRHTVRVSGRRDGKQPVTDSTTVATIFPAEVRCTTVLRSGKTELHNAVEWSIEGKVDGFQLWKNGFASTTVLSATTRSFIDDTAVASGADTYEVAGVIKVGDQNLVGPRGQCTGLDPEPNTTEPPRDLRIEQGIRLSADAPTKLVLSWTNGEAYDELTLSIFEDDGTVGGRQIETRVLNFRGEDGPVTQFVFDRDPDNPHPGGVAPQRYRFSLAARKGDRVSETRTSVGWARVDVPALGTNFTCTVSMGNEVTVKWDPAWRGYTGITLIAEGPDETRRIQLDLDASEFRDTVVPQGEYRYSLQASYDGPLPANFPVNPATLKRQCAALSFAPTLKVALAETGVGLSNARIPILADFFSAVSEVNFSVVFPAQLRVDFDPLHPKTVVRLNDQDDAKVEAQLVDLPADGQGGPRKRLSVQITEASFPPVKAQTLLWIVGRVDADFARAGTFPVKFDGEITVKPRGQTDALRIAADDAAGQLLIHKRFVIADRAEAAIGDHQPILIRVLATFDRPAGRPDYGIGGFVIHLKYNSKLLKLEPVTKADQRESVAAAQGRFFRGIADAQTEGDYQAVWIGLNDDGIGQIDPGINQPLLFLKFTPKIPEDPAGDFASIRFVEPPANDPTMFAPFGEPPSDGLPLEGFFLGGINIKPAQPVPTLISVSPARGPLLGGGKVLANGFGFLPEDEDAPEDSTVVLVQRPEFGNPAPRPAQLTGKSGYLLEFTVPPAALDPAPSIYADFDVEFRSPRGTSVLQNAYRYDALRITGTDRTSGSPSGSDAMTIYGYGIGPVTGAETDTRVEFRVQGVAGPILGEQLEVDPDGTRLRLVTPSMNAHAGRLAEVYVVTPLGRGTDGQPRWTEDRVPLPFLISSSPQVAKVNPPRGPSGGGTKVAIEVVGFPSPLNTGSAVDVKFGGVRAVTATVTGPNVVEAFTPSAAAGPVEVTVTHGAAQATWTEKFEYFQPRILSIDPTEGPAGGGTPVLVRYSDFEDLNNFELSFDGLPATSLKIEAEGLSAVTPSHAGAGTVAVRLRRGPLEATLPGAFTYRVPAISRVEPAKGPAAGGTVVTIQLSNFGAVVASPQVKFGATAAVVQSFGPTQVVVKTPAGAGPGPVDVTVTSGVSSAILRSGFTYEGQAVLGVTSVEPTSGPLCGGPKVLVRGTGFTSAVQVRFGAVLSPSVRLIDSATVEAVLPPMAENTTSVVVGVSVDRENYVEKPGLFAYRDDRPLFIRGDASGNGKVDLGDSGAISNYLTGAATAIPNLDAADANDDGVVNTGDLVALTGFLFLGTGSLPPPSTPGTDPTPDGIKGCPE